MIRHTLLWFASLTALCGPGPLVARDVTLAVPLSLQPYFIPTQGTGLIYDIVHTTFHSRGYTLIPFYIPVAKNATILNTAPQVDCAALVSDMAVGDWPSARGAPPLHDYAITLAAKGLRINEIEDLKGKNIIAYTDARNGLGAEFKAMADNNPRYREINNHRAKVRLLLKGRVDVIIADRLLVEWYIRYLENESGKRYSLVFHALFPPTPYYLVCREQELVNEYLAGLEAIRSNGELDRINERYARALSRQSLDLKPAPPTM